MHAPGGPRGRRSWLPLAGAALAVAAVCAVTLLRPGATAEPAAPASVAAESGPVAAAISPAPLSLPDDARVLVFGDSWVYGSAATTPSLGFAYRLADELGVETVVDGVRGSGYLKPGVDGPAYGERIAALDPALDPDLIVVEGSINDRRLHPDGYRDAVTAAWDALAARYPEADIVILGPAPQVLPVEAASAAGGTSRRSPRSGSRTRTTSTSSTPVRSVATTRRPTATPTSPRGWLRRSAP